MQPNPTSPVAPTVAETGPWYKTLTRYHWFVLSVAALGWLFDTMDQQLFNLARAPAMKALVSVETDEPSVAREKANYYGGLATSIFLIGWATGGIGFGILGDRIGRARTMMLTIIVYSAFTGLSAFSQSFWDFALWRFLTGLGVGGEFAVGVSLVAEVMPDRARPYALGLLQGFSAVGNIIAAFISIILGAMEQSGTIAAGMDWRLMFVIGTLPALLVLFIRRRLKEPERWQALTREGAAPQRLGSIAELFGDPRWRRRALVGLVLASSGVIGLWGIGFFAIDLNRSVFRKNFEAEARKRGAAEVDLHLVQSALWQLRIADVTIGANPAAAQELTDLKAAIAKTLPDSVLNLEPSSRDTQEILRAIQVLAKDKAPDRESVLEEIRSQQLKKGKSEQQASEVVARASTLLDKKDQPPLGVDAVVSGFAAVEIRSREISGRLTLWAGITSVMLNLGAAFGIYAFSRVTQRIGRRPAFAISFVLAMLSTMAVFWFLDRLSDVFWLIPLMGFCQLSLFGGYAIYFPELFPTRLRSTGISFCYNVGRFVAALGPFLLGLLTSQVFTEQKLFAEPMRYAGLVMCFVFVIGLLALPFAPETRGKPLPE